MSITKKTIADNLASQSNLKHTEALSIVAEFFNQIKQSLIADKPVKLSGFGNFTTKSKPARPGRNPKTGAPAIITARKVVVFKATPKLKSATEASA